MLPNPDLGSRESKMKQIKNWVGSETDKSSSDYHPPKKIKFPLGVSLIAACYANDEEEFKEILAMGVDINTKNQDGMTCVHQCCINGDYEFLEFLIKEGADINVQDNEGWTPLHAAASVGCEEMVRLLLDNGADVSLLSCEMELPVDVSQSAAVTELLNEAMQSRGVDPAVARQTEEQMLLRDVKHMLEAGKYEPVIDSRTGATPLHVAACKDYLTVLEMLLKTPGIDLNTQDHDGWTALHAAAHWNREASVRLLVEAGASFDLYTLANQSVFDVADRQIVVLLRQLRERQRAEKRTAPPAVSPAVEPLPKVPEAIKRGHPFDSESSEDSEESESSVSISEETSITANKKPALDLDVGPKSVAAGDHTSNGAVSMTDALTSYLDERPLVSVTEKTAKPDDILHSLSSPSVLGELQPIVEEKPSAADIEPPSSPPNSSSSQTTSTSFGESSTFGSTDTESDHVPFAVDGADIPKEDSRSIDLQESESLGKAAAVSNAYSPPELLTEIKNQNPSAVEVPVNGINNLESSPLVSLPTVPVAQDTAVKPVISRSRQLEDRVLENHVKLRSPPARRTSGRSPSPPPPPPRATTGATVVRPSSPKVDDEKSPSARTTRFITVRRQLPSESAHDGDANVSASVSSVQPAPPHPSAMASSGTNLPIDSNALASRPNRITRSPSPISGDEFYGNRRVSVVMAPTKSGETETQRSVKARYVRSTRRSTQGVSAEELEKAKQLVDKNNSAAVPTSNTSSDSQSVVQQPQQQKQVTIVNEDTKEMSLRPRLDRPTVRITRTPAASRNYSTSLPTAPDPDAQRRVSGEEKLPNYGTGEASRGNRTYRQSEAEERVKPSTNVIPSSSTTYFPYRGLSSRVSNMDEDKSNSRSENDTDVPSRNSRDRPLRPRLLDGAKYMDLNKRRAQRQGAPSPTSPPPSSNTNSTGTSVNDSAAKPAVFRPTSRFLHAADPSGATPASNTSSGTQTGNSCSTPSNNHSWATSYGTHRGTANTTPSAASSNQSHQQGGNLSTDSRPIYRERTHQIQDHTDYRRLFEQEKLNNERLERQLEEALRELSRLRVQLSKLTAQTDGNNTASDNKMTLNAAEELNRLREENLKMKEENGALIRVISKLSKPV